MLAPKLHPSHITSSDPESLRLILIADSVPGFVISDLDLYQALTSTCYPILSLSHEIRVPSGELG